MKKKRSITCETLPPTELFPTGLSYLLILSDRKTAALEIDSSGGLLVRAPFACTRQAAEALILRHQTWVAAQLARAGERSGLLQFTAAQEQLLRQQAAAILPAKVAWYARQMGVRPAGIRITGAAKRFGSCSSQGNLCFSFRVMAYPEAAIDYVVVHELAHLKRMDHSPAFWQIVAEVLPDFKQRRELLKDPCRTNGNTTVPQGDV